MPKILGLTPGEMSDCICAFAERLGPAKQQLVAFIQSVTAALEIMKTYWELTNLTIADEIRKVLLQGELAIYEAVVAELIAGINTIVGPIKQFSDCSPLASFSKIIKQALDDRIIPIYERQFEVEQLIAAISRKQRKTAKIQVWIDWLNAFTEALDACSGITDVFT